MNQTLYIVTLNLLLDAYEKYLHTLVYASSEEEACIKALEGECHNTPNVGEDSVMGYGTWDDSFFYRVYDIKEVSPEDEKTVIKYF
jgi:hypothetical protein